MKLTDKVAIVTGASRGLGKAMAIELAREGAFVAVAARTVEPGQSRLPGTIFQTKGEIERIGGKALSIRCDVTDEKDVADMVKQVNRRYGRVDIMINNAGVSTLEPFDKLPIKKWDLVVAVNLRGTFLCSKEVLPQMMEPCRVPTCDFRLNGMKQAETTEMSDEPSPARGLHYSLA